VGLRGLRGGREIARRSRGWARPVADRSREAHHSALPVLRVSVTVPAAGGTSRVRHGYIGVRWVSLPPAEAPASSDSADLADGRAWLWSRRSGVRVPSLTLRASCDVGFSLAGSVTPDLGRRSRDCVEFSETHGPEAICRVSGGHRPGAGAPSAAPGTTRRPSRLARRRANTRPRSNRSATA